jgi:flagellin FlaB
VVVGLSASIFITVTGEFSIVHAHAAADNFLAFVSGAGRSQSSAARQAVSHREGPNIMNASQRGITGLETAIILIAFVVVASVFAFTILSTGVFASERAKETIFAGLQKTKSTLRPSGSVIAFKGFVGSTAAIFKFSLMVESIDGADPIDLTPPYTADGSGTDPDSSVTTNKTTIVYIDDNQILQNVPWTIDFLGTGADNMLDSGEKAEIQVWLMNRSTGTVITSNSSVNYMASGGLTASGTLLTPNDRFTLEIQPPTGAVFTVRRTLPAVLDTVINLR